ncbi:MAG: hypothetical protein DI562_04290 [Stenotrophomonas acidaminiphila]|jgi:hypothetical protein|nr:MAG: hypothetical protein DI562_04290 [Stenotrophomonas acidaminiphila]
MDDTGIALDWKAVGRDFLDTLPEIYPDLAFLRCRAFATLRSQLANESADACFDALSGYLRAHEHQLWSVDTGGDAYRLHVVASADADAFASAHGEANGAGCERLASDAPAWKAPKAPRKKPPPLIEATDGHRSYGGLYTSGCEVRHALVPFENDTEAFELLVDLSVFPPKEREAEGFYALIDQGHRFHAVHATTAGDYWEWEPAVVRKGLPPRRATSLVRIRDYATPVLEDVEGSARSLHDRSDCAGQDDALCVLRNTRQEAPWFDPAAPVLDVLAPVGGGEDALVSLLRVDDRRLRHLASLSCGTGLQIRLLAPDRLLVLRSQPWTEAADGAMDYFLLDTRDAGLIARGQLPHAARAVGASIHPLGGDAMLYVREETQPHPAHAHLTEKTGWLVHLDLSAGRWREAALAGLHNDWTENMAFRRGDAPDRHRIRSFEGHVVFAPGHDGVVVLNYLTNFSGKHDAAWLWDRRTDQVTILRPADLDGGAPTVRYLPGMSRYVADDSCRLDLLVPYAEMQSSRPQTSLAWGEWQPLP